MVREASVPCLASNTRLLALLGVLAGLSHIVIIGKLHSSIDA